MKTRVLITFGLALLVVLFGSFMVREKEEALKPSVDYYLLQDRAFTTFIGNLRKMEALVFVPKSKVGDIKSMGLKVISGDKAADMNKQISRSADDWVQVVPSDKAGDIVSLSFQKLDMVCYVNKGSGGEDRFADQFTGKWDLSTNFGKVESVSVNASLPEELMIKVEGTRTPQAYVPVGIIDIPGAR